MRLKRCPFCGGDAELRVFKIIPSPPNNTNQRYVVRCTHTKCMGRSNKQFAHKSDAVKAWNKRWEGDAYETVHGDGDR